MRNPPGTRPKRRPVSPSACLKYRKPGGAVLSRTEAVGTEKIGVLPIDMMLPTRRYSDPAWVLLQAIGLVDRPGRQSVVDRRHYVVNDLGFCLSQ